MKIRRWPAWIAILAALALFPACNPGAGGIAVTVVDDLGTPLASVDLYVDEGITPAASTNANGEASLTLSGVHDVIVVNPAGSYQTYSFLNRDWDLVIALPVTLRRFSPYPLVADATIQFTLSGGVALRDVLVTATSPEHTATTTVTLDVSGNLTGGTLTVPAGTYYISAMHADSTAPEPNPADPINPKIPSYFGGFFGAAGPATVTSGATYTATIPLLIGAKELVPNASGGLTLNGAEISMGYQLFRNNDLTGPLGSNRTTATAATELIDQPMAPPSNPTTMTGFSFVVDVVSNTATNKGGVNYLELRRTLAFPSQVGLQQYIKDYTLVLRDYGLLGGWPGHGWNNLGQFPFFYYTIDPDQYPQFVEVEISEVVTAGLEYNLTHVVRDYKPHKDANESPYFFLPSATGGLSATGTYRYHIMARKLDWENGNLHSIIESGNKNICFAVFSIPSPGLPSC